MNRTTRENRLKRQRAYNENSRDRRLAAGRPLRSDVASAVLLAFLDAAVRHGGATSETVVEHLSDAGFVSEQSRGVIADLVRRHRDKH